jgi:hypothetical protein
MAPSWHHLWCHVKRLCAIDVPPALSRSIRAPTEAIQRFLDHWNDDCKPFVWVKTADDILAPLHRQRSDETH